MRATRTRSSLAVTLLLLSLPGSGALAASTPDIPFEKYQLQNGLEVILHPDTTVPTVHVEVWYKVGSKDEAPGRTGFAHLFEHLMFMGSQNVPVGKYDEWLEAVGASPNGSTSQDRTNYYQSGASSALALMLWLEADRMGGLLPTMTKEKLDLQRDVVKNERRQSYDNVPYGRAYETILGALYPASHPYSWPVIGSMADLSAARAAHHAALANRVRREVVEVHVLLVFNFFQPVHRLPVAWCAERHDRHYLGLATGKES